MSLKDRSAVVTGGALVQTFRSSQAEAWKSPRIM